MKAENNNTNIKSWSEEDRPREKMMSKGMSSLSDSELLAILIRTGTKQKTALDIAKEILQTVNYNLDDLGKKSIAELKKTKGIADVKAVTIAAALEMGRRRQSTPDMEKKSMQSSREVFEYIGPLLADLDHEQFWVIFLNNAMKVISKQNFFKGGVTNVIADAKLIFKAAVEHLATGIILVHNHPSGNLKPSHSDIVLTEKIKEAGKLFDIMLADHLIIADRNYLSFRDEGLI